MYSQQRKGARIQVLVHLLHLFSSSLLYTVTGSDNIISRAFLVLPDSDLLSCDRVVCTLYADTLQPRVRVPELP